MSCHVMSCNIIFRIMSYIILHYIILYCYWLYDQAKLLDVDLKISYYDVYIKLLLYMCILYVCMMSEVKMCCWLQWSLLHSSGLAQCRDADDHVGKSSAEREHQCNLQRCGASADLQWSKCHLWQLTLMRIIPDQGWPI